MMNAKTNAAEDDVGLHRELVLKIGHMLPFKDRRSCLLAHPRLFAGIMECSRKHTWHCCDASWGLERNKSPSSSDTAWLRPAHFQRKARALLALKPGLRKLTILFLPCFMTPSNNNAADVDTSDLVQQLQQLRAALPEAVDLRISARFNPIVAYALLQVGRIHRIVLPSLQSLSRYAHGVDKVTLADMDANQIALVACDGQAVFVRNRVHRLTTCIVRFGSTAPQEQRVAAARVLAQVPEVRVCMPLYFGITGIHSDDVAMTMIQVATDITDPSVTYDSIEGRNRLWLYGNVSRRLRSITFTNMLPSSFLCNRGHFDMFVKELSRPANLSLIFSAYSLRDPGMVVCILSLARAAPNVTLVISREVHATDDPVELLCAALAMHLCEATRTGHERIEYRSGKTRMYCRKDLDGSGLFGTARQLLQELRDIEALDDATTQVFPLWQNAFRF